MRAISEQDRATGTCSGCGAPVQECACCDEPGCAVAICYRCLNVALGQDMPHPHTHGG